MTEDWSQIKKLFAAAATVPVADRRGWLGARASPAVCQVVEDLLEADRDEPVCSLLDAPEPLLGLEVAAVSPPAINLDGAILTPDRVAGYLIRGVLGEGRTGIVYRALQEHPRREVALKLMRAGAWGREAVRRFETEVRVLAMLSHPGIARIYDSGTLPEPGGVRRPYIAMELIDGAGPISQFAGLSREAQIERLLQLCDAVAYAHQKGVIHRDIKPGNVLVDADGRVRVIDFGIARLEDAAGPATTMTGQFMGTPGYMSPEQLAGAGADTRSDVFAIGVIARELLGPSPDDLGVILAKATATDAAERYQSVGELASDLSCYLSNRPILARPPSLRYILGKAMRRHRVVTAAVSIGLVGLLAGGASLAISRAQISAANAEARDTVLVLLDEVVDKLADRIGSAAERRQIAMRVLPSVRRLAERYPTDRTMQTNYARLLRVLGDVEHEEGALTVALEHLRAALRVRERLASLSSNTPVEDAELATIVVRVGDVLGSMGDLEAQTAQYQTAFEVQRHLHEAFPENAKFASDLGYGFERLAACAISRGDLELAAELANRQISLATELASNEPTNPERLWDLTSAHATLAHVIGRSGRVTEERVIIATILDECRTLVRMSPSSRRFRVRLSSVLLGIAEAQLVKDEFDQALAAADEAAGHVRELTDADPRSEEGLMILERCCTLRVNALLGAGRRDECDAPLREGLAAADTLRALREAPGQRVDAWLSSWVLSRNLAVRLETERGNTAEADRYRREIAAAAGDVMNRSGLEDLEPIEARFLALSTLVEPTDDELSETVTLARARCDAGGGEEWSLRLATALHRAGDRAEAEQLAKSLVGSAQSADIREAAVRLLEAP